MSERPGTIIEEIVIDLPLRENPLERRKLPQIGPLQGRLMELLKVGRRAPRCTSRALVRCTTHDKPSCQTPRQGSPACPSH